MDFVKKSASVAHSPWEARMLKKIPPAVIISGEKKDSLPFAADKNFRVYFRQDEQAGPPLPRGRVRGVFAYYSLFIHHKAPRPSRSQLSPSLERKSGSKGFRQKRFFRTARTI